MLGQASSSHFANDLKQVHAYNLRVLDLKAKLAAAGLVTKEQVDKIDADQARARDKKLQDLARADERRAAKSRPNNKRSNNKRPNNKRSKAKRSEDANANASGIDVAALKELNRGDAYTRIRKIVEHSRLDDKERTIPKPDDQIFNFVTSTGRVSRLYLTAKTVKSLTEGKSAISSFMSHHGLSHCVLPQEVAVALAEVFPLWLRHLEGHPAAGLMDEPKPESEPGKS